MRAIPGMEIEEGGHGPGRPRTAGHAASRWSLGPHEQLIGMAILSVAFVIGSLSVDAGLRSRNQPPRSDQVTVTGSAEQAVTADTFQWDASVASTQPDNGVGARPAKSVDRPVSAPCRQRRRP